MLLSQSGAGNLLRAAIGEEVISLVVLADLNPEWKPEEYRYERLGCEIIFRYPSCKLLEILPRLKNNQTLPALAAQAQIEALQTSRNPDKRLAARWKLTRKLYAKGWKKKDIYKAFRLLAWMMKLPEAEYLILKKKVVSFDKKSTMHTAPLLDYEEYAMKEGMRKGQQEMILELLKLRFGNVPKGLEKMVRGIHEEKRLLALFEKAATCPNMEAFSVKLSQ